MLRWALRRAHTSLSRLAGGWLTTPGLAHNILEDLFNQERGTNGKCPVPDDDFPLSGPRGIRTPGLLNAIEARSQLRYGPL
jgi:hypothetical protein